MSRSENVFALVEARTEQQIDACAGPDELGHCPQVAWGDVVRCAGHQLRPLGSTRAGTWRIIVPKDSVACPVQATRATRRSVWSVGALVALVGIVAGAAGAAAIALALTSGAKTAAPATSTSGGATAAKAPAVPPFEASAIVAVSVSADRFTPAFLTIAAGTIVTWHNTGRDGHTVTTAPGLSPMSFDIAVAPGGSASHWFSAPGLYVIYARDQATWDATTGLPRPLPGSGRFPEAMAGIIAVTGPGATTAAAPVVAVPGDRYAPAFLTITAGTTVTWTNGDTSPHTVTTAPGLAPAAFDLSLAAGATASFQFTTPGLYVIYGKDHAAWDTSTGLPKPDPGSGVYPEPMAGAVFVVPAGS